MSTTFNTVDLIFFAFTAIFVLTAVLRGFVKEIFALLNWVLALTLSYLITPYVTDFLSAHFESKVAVDLVSRSGIFMVVFLLTAISTSGMRDSLYEKTPRAFDRSLGLLYGFLKTLLIFGVIYSLYFNVYGLVLGNKLKGEAKEPAWMQQARSRALIKGAGDAVDPLVKKFMGGISGNFDKILPKSDELGDKIEDVVGGKNGGEVDQKSVDEAKPLTDSELEKSLDTGYSKKNIEKMNQLMEIINK